LVLARAGPVPDRGVASRAPGLRGTGRSL